MTKQRRSQEARAARKQRIRRDAKRAVPENAMRRCIVWGCSKLPQLADATGLSPRFCRAHVKHMQRHGSPHRKTWPAAMLRPYLRSSALWLKQNADQSMVQRVIEQMQLLLDTSGRPETAFAMLRADADRKAKVALARLRVAGVKPERLVVLTLATWAIAEDDISERTTKEFRIVALGKQANRLSARWMPERAKAMPKGSFGRRTYEKFSEPSGSAVRSLAKAIDDVANHLVDRAVPNILTLKRTKFGPHPSRQSLANERAA